MIENKNKQILSFSTRVLTALSPEYKMKMKWVKFGVSPSSKMDALVVVGRSQTVWLATDVWCYPSLGPFLYTITNTNEERSSHFSEGVFILLGQIWIFIWRFEAKLGKIRTDLEISISNFGRLKVRGHISVTVGDTSGLKNSMGTQTYKIYCIFHFEFYHYIFI